MPWLIFFFLILQLWILIFLAFCFIFFKKLEYI